MKPKRILIAEDNQETVKYIQSILEVKDYDLETVENGNEALAMLQTGKYDLLICDEHLPGIDGYTLLRTLRHSPSPNWIPIIMIEDRPFDSEGGIRSSLRGGADMIIIRERYGGGLLGIGVFVEKLFSILDSYAAVQDK